MLRYLSLVTDAGGVVNASVLVEVERASTVVQGEDSASKVLSLVTRSVVESVLNVRPAAVPMSVEQLSSVVVSGSPFAAVDTLGPEVEQLSVVTLSPGPVDICVETAATAADGCVIVAAGPIHVSVQTDGGLHVLIKLIDRVKHCVLCKLHR